MNELKKSLLIEYMTLYVSKVSTYQTDRLFNMKRHLEGEGYRVNAEDPESLLELCDTYENEQEYAKQQALEDREQFPATLDMDLTPFFQGYLHEVNAMPGIFAKMLDISHQIENQKYEQVITKMFGNQMTFCNGSVRHKGGTFKPSNLQYYRLYKTVALAYGHYLYETCAASKCDKYRTQIANRAFKVGSDKTTEPVITKRVKEHIKDTMYKPIPRPRVIMK